MSSLDASIAALSPGALVYQDRDLIVVDKPAGVSVQSPERHDDLVSRVAALLQAPPNAYLSVHGYLDRDVSGLVVLARRPEINAPLAAQVREGTMRLCWVAAVQGCLPRPSGTSHVRLVRDRDGTVRAASASDRQAEPVELRWRLLDAQADRSLLGVELDRDGARRLRAALHAVLGVAVAGDVGHGAAQAPRLMLHAHAVELTHPGTGKKLVLRSQPPGSFDRWMQGGAGAASRGAGSLAAMLREAAVARYPIRAAGQVSAYRLFHGEGEGLAGVDVDRLADHLVVWVGEQFEPRDREALLDAAAALGPDGVYLKVRPRHASRVVDSRTPQLAPSRALRGADAPEELVVRERDLRFVVRPGDGLSTGLFLDQRENRAWFAEQCDGCSVLNLFAYTCSFTVAAARGGARSSVSIDASQRVLQTGARNLEINAVAGDRHVLVCDDVLRWLPQARKRGLLFDRIVLDPPSFSTTHKSRFSFASDIGAVAEHCFGLMPAAGGILLVCTNHRTTTRLKLRRSVEAAAARAQRRVARAQWLPTQLDFPSAPGAEPHMKALAVHVEHA